MSAKAGYKTIVVPWNFSASCRKSLAEALELAGEDTRIRVVHVAAPLSGPDNGALYELSENRRRKELETRFFRELPANLKSTLICFDVEYGYVGREIKRYADRWNADLIVMSSRERKGFLRFLMGDLSGKVVRLASCPVLVLRQTKEKIFPQTKSVFNHRHQIINGQS